MLKYNCCCESHTIYHPVIVGMEPLVVHGDESLNTIQQQIIDAWTGTHDNIFCTGHGGTGKSWILRKLCGIIRSSGKRLAITAPTGAAAFNIGGVTINKFAGTGIETENIGKMIAMASKKRTAIIWRTTDILVIDEISMVSGIFFENLNIVAQTIRRSSLPFGGIRLFLLGDFLQLPPVSQSSVRPFRAFECEAWKQCNMRSFILTKTMRQTDTEFISNLANIRVGVCDKTTTEYFNSLSRDLTYSDGIEPVRLFAMRKDVDSYNLRRLEQIDSTLRSFDSTDTGPVSALAHCPVPSKLHLKKGCQVMLVRNISESLVNGTVGTVRGFKNIEGEKVPTMDIIGSNGQIKKIVLQRVQWESMDINGSVAAVRTQFPLILAWAITIHKGQGRTIPRLFVNMTGIFECGQAYVALSRCQSPDNLQVINFSSDLVKTDPACIEFQRSLVDENSTVLAQPMLLNSHRHNGTTA
jgi:ATP-dependent DNA helicase PIF1